MAVKRQWVSPVIRRYGTFETATQECNNKSYGVGDGWLFNQQPTAVVCAS